MPPDSLDATPDSTKDGRAPDAATKAKAPRPISPSRKSMGSTVGDALAVAARAKVKPPAAKFWVWLILFVAVGAIGLAQILGWTSSPVADKIRGSVEEKKKDGATKPGEKKAGEKTDAEKPNPPTK